MAHLIALILLAALARGDAQSADYVPFVSTLAGSSQSLGFLDGSGASAQFGYLIGVAVDASGNVFLGDSTNNRIRKVTPGGVVSTLAGILAGGQSSFADGTGTAAKFNGPYGVAVDAGGYVFVADFLNHAIRRVTPGGEVSTLAGNGAAAFADGVGRDAFFKFPRGVAVDLSGNVFVAEQGNHCVRKVTPGGVVSTVAGSGVDAFADGAGAAASFRTPGGVAVDLSGNVFVADQGNHCVRKVTPGGVVSTIAGSGAGAFADGIGAAASFNSPSSLTIDSSGNVLVADTGNHRIRKVSPRGVVTTLAGNGDAKFADGSDNLASFKRPYGIAVGASGAVFVADTENLRVRKFTVSTCASGSYCPTVYTQAICPPGSFCTTGSSAPTPCPPGSFSSTGVTSCTPCARATYAAANGSVTCACRAPTAPPPAAPLQRKRAPPAPRASSRTTRAPPPATPARPAATAPPPAPAAPPPASPARSAR
jgi:sugar lactone lactonase YvrE